MKFGNMLFKLGGVMCSFAFMMAISSLDTMCVSSFYQPEVPTSLNKFKKG